MKKIALLMDVDGTLVTGRDGKGSSTWEAVLEECRMRGVSFDRDEEFLRRYVSGEEEKVLEEWMLYDLERISRVYDGEVEERAMKRLRYREGVRELVEYAKRMGWEIELVSAGFSPLIRRIAEELGVEVGIDPGIEVKEHRYRRLVTGRVKGEYVKRKKKEGYFVIYIGDGFNDREAFREADLSISVRAHQQEAIYADLKEALAIIKAKVQELQQSQGGECGEAYQRL